jgi:hypothetical protein
MLAVSSMHGMQPPPAEPKVDIAGIEPATSCMLSMRAANCAKRPLMTSNNVLRSCFYSNLFVDAVKRIYPMQHACSHKLVQKLTHWLGLEE